MLQQTRVETVIRTTSASSPATRRSSPWLPPRSTACSRSGAASVTTAAPACSTSAAREVTAAPRRRAPSATSPRCSPCPASARTPRARSRALSLRSAGAARRRRRRPGAFSASRRASTTASAAPRARASSGRRPNASCRARRAASIPDASTRPMMGLGATVACTPGDPRAAITCPVDSACVARAEGRQADLPVIAPETRRSSGRVAMVAAVVPVQATSPCSSSSAPRRGLFGGLWGRPWSRRARSRTPRAPGAGGRRA